MTSSHQTRDLIASKAFSRSVFLRRISSVLKRNKLGELLVLNGVLTPAQLKSALRLQKETQLALGQILISHNIISKPQLAGVLIHQAVLKSLAMLFFFSFTITNFSGKKAYADYVQDIPARIAIAAPDVSREFTSVSSYPALFESDEKRSSNLEPFTKWTKMFQRFDRELKKSSSQQIIKDWQKQLSAYQGLPLKQMATRVNSAMNAKRYIGDNKNWGQSDYWATPVEFLQRGGDCEDYAIAKYTALRMLGVPESRMRVAIVHDNQKNIPHAVLVVYTDEGTLVLDNQNAGIVNGDRLARYRPIFSINRSAWWLHTVSKTTQIASAQ